MNRTEFICPYYMKSGQLSLRCEAGRILFPEAQSAREFYEDRCMSWGYQRCCLARMLTQYYEDQED